MTTDGASRETCTTCGANLEWDPGAGALKCVACTGLRAVGEDGAGSESIVEHDLAAMLRSAKPRGALAPKARQVRCSGCGAEVIFAGAATATRCDFCDSPSVLATDAQSDRHLPESLVPFAVARAAAGTAFSTWQRRLWFRPSDLSARSVVAELRGVYLPYWTFDCEVDSRWTADAGHYYYVTESYSAQENGKSVSRTRQVQHTRWVPSSGRRHDSWDDFLVCASRGLPEGLGGAAREFATGALVPYSPEYLQGFAAEAYGIDLEPAWKSAETKITATQKDRCARDVPGDTQRNLRVRHAFSDTSFKHVLLPMWVMAYRYGSAGKVYRVLVNGQSGVVGGEAPWSAGKIVAFVAALAGAAVLAWLALR
ncbi:MAG: zinc ribbon domain-containing protein [Myxococcales bacterium]|nr:zinc ribbon domain-containing protein [Myxococcales bacterium]